MREGAFMDIIRMTNSSAVWLSNLAEEADVLKGLFAAGPASVAVRRSPENAAALASHLSHLNRRLDDCMRVAARRDHGFEPLRALASQALRGAIKRCGRGGAALATTNAAVTAASAAAAAAAAAAAYRALTSVRLLIAVVALSRQQETHMIRPRAALLQAGALGINLMDRAEEERVAEEEFAAQYSDDAATGTVGEGEDPEQRKKKKQQQRDRAKAKRKQKKNSAGATFSFGVFAKGAQRDGAIGASSSSYLDSESKEGSDRSSGGLARLENLPLVDPKVPAPTTKELDVVWQRVYEAVTPGMVLHLEAGERWLRRHRYAPPRFNSAALLLQYAVDSRVDETLREILTEVSTPPLVRDPYPAAVSRLRAAGHRADISLHRDVGGAGSEERKRRPPRSPHAAAGTRPRITMVQPPAPVYAARPPAGSPGAASSAAVYGIYSAVSLSDPTRICRLRDEIPDLLKARAWQEGPFQFQRIAAFGGDAAFSSALGAAGVGAAAGRRGKKPSSSGSSGSRRVGSGAGINLLGFTPVIEERTRVTGPDKSRASDIYAADVVRRLLEM